MVQPAEVMARRLIPPARLALGLLAMSLAGCLPLARPARLPPPALGVTRTAPTAAALPASATPATTTETPVPPIPGLLQLAANTYGKRLIVGIEIPTLEISSPVVAVGWTVKETADGQSEIEWDSPESLAGWVVTSALPGEGSNIILYGHNNLYTSIFRDLGDLKAGDEITLRTGERSWAYRVDRVLYLRTAFADQETLQSYEKYLRPTEKEQLTLISCWPPVSNTHRVVVIAEPRP